jgi:hypothetical protein
MKKGSRRSYGIAVSGAIDGNPWEVRAFFVRFRAS